MADELGIDAGLTNPPCNQLAVLTAEVDDQHRTIFRPDAGNGSGMTSAPNSSHTSPLTHAGSSGFLRDHHVMRVALAQARAGDPHEAGSRLQCRSSRRRSSPSPAQAADELVDDRRQRPLVRHAAFDALGHELLDVLDVALAVAVLENERAFIAPSEPMPRYSLKRSPW